MTDDEIWNEDGTLGIAIDTRKDAEDRNAAAKAAMEAWEDDMREEGWTEEQIDKFLRTH